MLIRRLTWWLVSLAVVAPAGALELSFVAEGPVLTGLEAAAPVAWLAVTRESRWDYERVRVERTVVPATPGLTRSALPWPEAVPRRSTFVAVDLTTGQAAVGTQNPDGVPRGNGGGARSPERGVAIPGQSLQVLVVRPGGFVWHGAVADGANEDLDGAADGVISFDLDALKPEGTAPDGATTAAGDRVWAIDLDKLTLHELVLVGGAP